MRFSYNQYYHDHDEVGLTIEFRSIFDRFHRRIGEIQTYHIVGVKQAASQIALTGDLFLLEQVYAEDFGDIRLEDNDEADTQHVLTNASTFSGIQVAHFGYPQGSWDMQTEYGAGGNCKRTFHAILTAEKRVGPSAALYAYRERVTQVGTGGPKQRYMASLTGTPVLQTLRQETVIRYVQEGYVIGRGEHLIPPAPIASLGTELVDQRVITVSTPEDIRVNGEELFQTNYRYTFETLASQVFSMYSPGIGAFP